MAHFKPARDLRSPAIEPEEAAPAIVHVVPGWATALCGAMPGRQPANAVPTCRRCLSLLSGDVTAEPQP